MPELELWGDYARKDVHAIFSPLTVFTPQAGTWGLHGMVPIPAHPGDWVFFVTFGQSQGHHAFDESITEAGILSWQSQPKYRIADAVIQQLIHHDASQNNIYLFLRTSRRGPYSYLGKLGYVTHDTSKENPVHFQWQLLDWPAPPSFLQRIGVQILPDIRKISLPVEPDLTVSPVPTPREMDQGATASAVHHYLAPDYAAQDEKNRALGLAGELMVLAQEKRTLIAARRKDLAEQVVHVSVVEGDGAGYDIRSFNPDGSVRFIEVKTTQGNANSDFYISLNEVAFSVNNSNAYHLYRVYQFDPQTGVGKLFILKGDLRRQLKLVPASYRASLLES